MYQRGTLQGAWQLHRACSESRLVATVSRSHSSSFTNSFTRRLDRPLVFQLEKSRGHSPASPSPGPPAQRSQSHQWELTTLHRANSQHIRRLAWCSARLDAVHLMGSTSQFSSDSYRARMNSPGRMYNRERSHFPRAGTGAPWVGGMAESDGWRLGSWDSEEGGYGVWEARFRGGGVGTRRFRKKA